MRPSITLVTSNGVVAITIISGNDVNRASVCVRRLVLILNNSPNCLLIHELTNCHETESSQLPTDYPKQSNQLSD